MISIEDFKKIEIKLGQILSVKKIPETEKLLKLFVDFGEESPRQIVSGISPYFPDPGILINKKCMFVTNLEPRTIYGIESQAMILAILDQNGLFSLIVPEKDLPIGVKAG